MEITGLRVQHTRSHDDETFAFESRVSVITGRNGSGKTTLLEALHVALRGTSFRGSDGELLQLAQQWWRIDVRTADGESRVIKFDSAKQTGRKQFDISSKTSYRLSPAQKYPVVLFEPDDLRLLSGSPARRRQFVDTFISQINPLYPALVRKFERALKQRNTLLKHHDTTRDAVFVWDMALAEYGAEMIRERTQIIERINASLTDTYRSIAGTDDTATLHYSHTMIDGIQQRLANDLHANFERDKLLGFTTTGPHRHDIISQFNESAAIAVASRGEIRSMILALKFIEVDVAEQATGMSPIVLLDDVFAELDETRQQRLAEKCRGNQMFITSTNAYTGIDSAAVISLD
ncbi:MAG: replication and repair protein RecF protein [Candidatus Saccharibacteria bacterium GW2011_GWC2_48_9]|nr:MAG: replication and repair protein RecF protein [Candidatus Saccharibacteria bacterium GW2011_GWC2_48_9]HCH34592.1 DNA replication/repair protein RecF [Candidatus Saccharibacteria bacterium]